MTKSFQDDLEKVVIGGLFGSQTDPLYVENWQQTKSQLNTLIKDSLPKKVDMNDHPSDSLMEIQRYNQAITKVEQALGVEE